MQSQPRPEEPLPPGEAAATDADRSVEDVDEDELVVPLEAPIETPVDDLIDQRRTVPLEDPDEH